MKKTLFALTVVAFVLSTIVCLMYSPIVGIVVGIASALLIWADWYLVKNDARWLTIIAIFILALILAFFAGTRFAKMRACIRLAEYEAAEELPTEVVIMPEEVIEYDEEEPAKDTQEPVVVEKQVIVEKVVEVPVEKQVIVEKVVEVPVEVQKEVTTPPQTTDTTNNNTTIPPQNSVPVTTPPTPNYNNVYYGDPTGNYSYGNYNNGYNYGYGSGYYGDPTGGSYGYNSNNTSSVKISGDKTVTAGETVTYTISGVSKVKENKLDLPANVSVQDISGNKVELYFEDGWTGAYSIGYDSAVINVRVTAD